MLVTQSCFLFQLGLEQSQTRARDIIISRRSGEEKEEESEKGEEGEERQEEEKEAKEEEEGVFVIFQ